MNFNKFLYLLFLSVVISISFNYSVFAAKLTVPDNLIGKRTLYLVPGSQPATAQEGQIYFCDTDNLLYYYTGTDWVVLSGGGGDKVVATRVVAAYNSLTPDGPSSCVGDGSACDNLKADFTCDGTDDQLKIQDAINALEDNPGVVYLLEGTYNISGPITLDTTSPVDSGKAIIGSGAGTVLRAAANVNLINADTVNGILISQVRIDGNNKTGSNGINFNTVTNSKINQAWIENMSRNGIFLNASNSNNTISGNNIQSNGSNGIYIFSSSNNNIISGNNIQSNGSGGSHGIYLQSSSGNVISSNNIQGIIGGSQQNGIYLNSASNNTISGNNTQSNGYHGIYLYSSSNSNTISGNNSQSNSLNGIYVRSSSSNNTISGNTFQSNGNRGIYIYTTSSNNVVTGNVVYDNGAATNNDGMRIEDNSDNNLVSSNLLYHNPASGTGRPINIPTSTCDNTYLAGNLISSWPASYNTISDTGTTTRYTQKEKITIERQVVVAPANGDTLDVTTSPKGYLPLLPTAVITLNAVTAIADGKAVGDLLILEGRSDTNTVTIPNNANTRLGAATRVLGLEDTLKLLWNGADWLELTYSNN